MEQARTRSPTACCTQQEDDLARSARRQLDSALKKLNKVGAQGPLDEGERVGL